jgi:hypothetical protein
MTKWDIQNNEGNTTKILEINISEIKIIMVQLCERAKYQWHFRNV